MEREKMAQKISNIRDILSPFFTIALITIGPFADFNNNVLQRLVFLTLLNVKYPLIIESLFTLTGELSRINQSSEDPSKQTSLDKVLNIDLKDKYVEDKFRENKI